MNEESHYRKLKRAKDICDLAGMALYLSGISDPVKKDKRLVTASLVGGVCLNFASYRLATLLLGRFGSSDDKDWKALKESFIDLTAVPIFNSITLAKSIDALRESYKSRTTSVTEVRP